MRKLLIIGIIVSLAAVSTAQASPDFPIARAEAKAKKIARKRCINKALSQIEKGRPYTHCVSYAGHDCMSGGDVQRPANEGVCVASFVVSNSQGTKSAYCSGLVYLKWDGAFMRRVPPRSPYFCLPL